MRAKLCILLVILVLIPTAGCGAKDNDDTSYYYKLHLSPESLNDIYTIQIPILAPLSEKDVIEGFEASFINNISIMNGDPGTIRANNTEYGETLLIQAKGDITIKSKFEAKYDKHKTYIFSTRQEDRGFAGYDGKYWAYFNSTVNNSITFTLSYQWGDNDFGNRGLLDSKINESGWLSIIGYEEQTISSYR